MYKYWKSHKDGKYYWHYQSPNGEIVCCSGQGLKSAKACKKAINCMKRTLFAGVVCVDDE
jgi:uncharacterized protein YegP (UPF0339 family)